MFKLILGLIAVMAGNILLGTSLATLKETFNKETFWNGVLKALFVVAGCCLMYLTSWLNPNIFVAKIAGTDVNLISGMELLFTAGIVLYGSACLIKLKDILGVKINVESKETAQNQSEGVSGEDNIQVAQAYDSAAVINEDEDIIQDGIRAEGSI
jgi:small basic protein